MLTHKLFTGGDGQTFQHQHKRPDIVIIDKDNRRATLVEIAIPFDAHISKSYQTKFDKYYPLSLEINNLGFRSEIVVLIIGSLGNVHQKVITGLIKAGLSRNDAKFITKFCSISSIIGSNKIWRMRCKYHDF